MHVPRATLSEWIVTIYFCYVNPRQISLLPGSHHIGVQADTVRPATNNPILSQGQLGIKPAPQNVHFQQPIPTNSQALLLTYLITLIINKMCKHEMYVILPNLRFYPCLTSTPSIGDFYRGCGVCLLVALPMSTAPNF